MSIGGRVGANASFNTTEALNIVILKPIPIPASPKRLDELAEAIARAI